MDLFNILWPILLTAAVTAIGTYAGFIHGLRIKVAVLEHKVEKVDERLSRKSKQFDEIQQDLADIKQDIAKISATLEYFINDKKG